MGFLIKLKKGLTTIVVSPFHLVRRQDDADGSHRYASHTTWESREAFTAWTESDAFRKAHAGNPMPKGLMLGPPQIMLWESVEL